MSEVEGAPGFTATDLNAHRGRQTIPEGAAAAVRLTHLPDDGPTEAFFSASNPEPGISERKLC
jgi:hypothetical protein